MRDTVRALGAYTRSSAPTVSDPPRPSAVSGATARHGASPAGPAMAATLPWAPGSPATPSPPLTAITTSPLVAVPSTTTWWNARAVKPVIAIGNTRAVAGS